MSSQFSDLPSSFIPPESAQPYQSLFGGPSSQDVDLEPYPESEHDAGDEDEGEEGAGNEDDFDTIMRDMPIIDDDNVSDATYHASDQEEPDGGARCDDSASPKKRKQKPVSVPVSPPSSPPAYERPNRFRGPESTWRRLTAEERGNVRALEAIRARDLSAHLYNSYALRMRAYERGQRAVRKTRQQAKIEPFVPPRRWTAWPMSADEVPRPDERLRREEDDAWTFRMPPDPRPSADLEESVIAIMLETAKDRFYAREWDGKQTKLQRKRSGSLQLDNHEVMVHESDLKSDPELADEAELRPLVQADDDKSRRQLRPMSRNILTQFDKLLMGLHHAQKGGDGGDSSGSERQSDTEGMGFSTSSLRKRGRPDETEQNRARGRRQGRGSSCTGGRPISTRQDMQHRSRSRARPHRRRNGRSASRLRQGLRDWSEVVGIAAMIGLPSSAVMRTAKRCSALFGEDMAFHTFHEGTVEKVKEDEVEEVRYVEPEPTPEPETPPPSSREASRKPRSRASSIRRETTSRPASPTTESNGEALAGKGKGKHRKADLVCPLTTCSRHTNGFSRTWNLNLHMKRMHPHYRPGSSQAGSVVNDDEGGIVGER